MKKLIIIGASGHGKVVLDIAIACNYEVLGFIDDNKNISSVLGYPVLGDITKANKYKEMDTEFIVAIGDNDIRKKIVESLDIPWATLIHPSAIVSEFSEIGEGTVIMPNVVVNANTKIMKHVIINTGAIVDHDNQIGNYVHVSVKASLAGNVKIGDSCCIFMGANIVNNTIISNNVTIGASSLVLHNIEEKGKYAGVPAKRL